MARSTLFALLVLALIQVSWALPYGYNQIINVAANGALIGYRERTPFVEKNQMGTANKFWGINEISGGATIFMPPASAFLRAVSKTDVLVSGGPYPWAVNSAGNGKYTIKAVNEDLVLDWNEDSSIVSLKPANGNPSQQWRIGSSLGYSRMFNQC
ncbi:unnamed protein product [Mortierella alpina]